MKKLLLFILFFLLSGHAMASIAFVNSSVFQGGAGSVSVGTTGVLSTSSGNLIVVTVSMNSTGTHVTTITDTAGNTYHQASGCLKDDGVHAASDIWYAYNIIGNAANQVTVNMNQANIFNAASQLQYSGAKSGSDPFQVCGNGESDSATVVSSSFNPTIANGVNVMNEYDNGGGGSVSSQGGYTTRASGWHVGDFYPASAGSQTSTWTYSVGTAHLFLSVASFAPDTSTTINGATINGATIT